MKKQQLIILGAGESGTSAARLARREGFGVFVSDLGPGNGKYLTELEAAGIPYETRGHTESRILAADLVVKSPGIPDTAPLIRQLVAQGTPVISEIEFAYRFVNPGSTIVGVTGSNGKTTTTMLVHQLLKKGGRSVLAGGNLGDSFARLLLEHPAADVYVLELSSFQLDGISSFRPDIAAVLNITPDHLDRYGYQLESYADSKLRIAQNQRAEDHLLLLHDEKTIAPALRRSKTAANIETIDPVLELDGDQLTVDGATYSLATAGLPGRHNAMNALFAIRIARLLLMDPQRIQAGLDTFLPAAHRMERVPTGDGRTWINDSKATNVDSAYYALDSMRAPTVWIAGGTDKGNEYEALAAVVGRVHTLICLGLDNGKLMEAFGSKIGYVEENRSMESAVLRAGEVAKAGETILLSPACASFDLFKNYVDRGDQFRDYVKKHFA